MDTHLAQPVERRHWSFSALNNFTNCARKFHAYDIAKTVREPENPKMLEGHRVHKAMADHIGKGIPLPPEWAHYAKWVPATVHDDKVLVEHKMACTFQLEPCEYFDKKKRVWLRTVADLLIMNDDWAVSIDWKTGKEPDERWELLPKNFQLRLTAVTVFLHFPQVKRVRSIYTYLNEGVKSEFDMERSDLREFIPQMYEYAGTLQRAVRTGHFPPRPSGLCKRHCAVTGCEYHGKGG